MGNQNGAAYAAFNVTLSEAAEGVLDVQWATEDGTGHAGTDYEATSGTLSFQPGETSKQIQVQVYGRDPADSTEERSFNIRLTPPLDAVLNNATAECVIKVVTEGGAVFTEVYLPAGPRGRAGDKGDTGLSTYELAVINGFVGTLAQWLATVTGRNIELVNDGTYIKWRPVDTENPQAWQNLVSLASLHGTNGIDGKQVQMQKSTTAIQWRLEGGSWTDLVQLSDLKGDKGDKGDSLNNRGNWVTGTTYNSGDYVTATSSASSTTKSLFFLLGSTSYTSSTWRRYFFSCHARTAARRSQMFIML